MQVANDAVVLGQGLFDMPRLHQLVVHRLDDTSVFRVSELLLHPLQGDLQRGKHRIERQGDAGRVDAGFGDCALQYACKAIGGVEDEVTDQVTRDRIEAERRIDNADVEVVMRDQALVLGVGLFGSLANEVPEPIGAVRGFHHRVGSEHFGFALQRIVVAADGPLDRAVNVVFGLRLGGVERVNRIGVVVAQDTRAPDGLLPVLLLERCDEVGIPAGDLFRRTAPIGVAHVQDMVLEILERLVGCLRSFQVELDMLEEQALPVFSVGTCQALQGVERQLVMGAVGVSGINDAEKKAHGVLLPDVPDGPDAAVAPFD